MLFSERDAEQTPVIPTAPLSIVSFQLHLGIPWKALLAHRPIALHLPRAGRPYESGRRWWWSMTSYYFVCSLPQAQLADATFQAHQGWALPPPDPHACRSRRSKEVQSLFVWRRSKRGDWVGWAGRCLGHGSLSPPACHRQQSQLIPCKRKKFKHQQFHATCSVTKWGFLRQLPKISCRQYTWTPCQ